MKDTGESLFERLLRQLHPVFYHLGALGFFINLLVLPVSLYSLQVFDRVLTTGSIATLFWLTFIMIILFAAAGALQTLRSMMLQRLGDWLHEEISLQVIPITLMTASQGSGKGAQGMRDTGTLKQFVAGTALVTLMDAPWAILYISLLFYIHFYLGILVTAGAILLLLLTWVSEIFMRAPMKKAGGLQLRYMQELEYSTRNADVIEAMGMMGTLTARWHRAQATINDFQTNASSRSALLQGITKFVRLSMQILVTAVAAWLAIRGDVTTGAIIAASILSSRALAPFEAIIASWKALAETRAAYARLKQLLALKLRQQSISLPAPAGVLTVENLTFAMPGSPIPLLRQIRFQAMPGEILGIVGPSGCGKSTLARLITGIWQPSSGIVRLDGADVFSWPREEFGRFTGYMPQDVELFSGTVRENICRLQLDATDEAVVQAAQMANAHDLILRLRDGYDTPIGFNGAMLSAGQRQRIALARAFYGLPRLMVLDEPDASLDDAGKQALVAALQRGRDLGMTSIVITHHKAILAHVDKLLVLQNGQVEAFGATQEVLASLQARQLPVTERP